MKRAFKAVCAGAVAVVASVAAAAFAGCNASPHKTFKKATGVAVPECGGVTVIDTRGGFHGDGELIYTFYLDEDGGRQFESKVKSAVGWRSLPMSETLDELVYEHFNGKIPRAEKGYYFFYDEQHKTYGDGEVLNAFSYDFTVGMFDTETQTVYYYEQHT